MNYKEIAEQSLENMDKMICKLARLANGNGLNYDENNWGSAWPDEEELSEHLGVFFRRDRELRKQMKELEKEN